MDPLERYFKQITIVARSQSARGVRCFLVVDLILPPVRVVDAHSPAREPASHFRPQRQPRLSLVLRYADLNLIVRTFEPRRKQNLERWVGDRYRHLEARGVGVAGHGQVAGEFANTPVRLAKVSKLWLILDRASAINGQLV